MFRKNILFSSKFCEKTYEFNQDAHQIHHSCYCLYYCNFKLCPSPSCWRNWRSLCRKFRLQAKLYIPSTLNTDYLLWHTQLIVCAVKYKRNCDRFLGSRTHIAHPDSLLIGDILEFLIFLILVFRNSEEIQFIGLQRSIL